MWVNAYNILKFFKQAVQNIFPVNKMKNKAYCHDLSLTSTQNQ